MSSPSPFSFCCWDFLGHSAELLRLAISSPHWKLWRMGPLGVVLGRGSSSSHYFPPRPLNIPDGILPWTLMAHRTYQSQICMGILNISQMPMQYCIWYLVVFEYTKYIQLLLTKIWIILCFTLQVPAIIHLNLIADSCSFKCLTALSPLPFASLAQKRGWGGDRGV